MRKDVRLGMLPDLFLMENGKRVGSPEDWEIRRKELLDSALALEFDGMPPEPEEFWVESLHGRGDIGSYRIHCGTKEKPFSFCCMAYIPEGPGPFPVVVTGDAMYVNNCNDRVIGEALRRGFCVVKFNRTELAPDYADPDKKSGIHTLWPKEKFSTISAWAWGYHRVVDALMQLSFADCDHIAITGHSRGGKAVLLAGATDTRIRYTNPNGSGTHGCGCYRFYQQEEEGAYADQHSETLAFMFQHIPYWMGEGLRDYIGREQELPHDSHFIKALIAPRCFLETNGYGDIWANPRGSWLSWLAAREAWKLTGNTEKCAAWYREGGHKHGWEDFNALFDFMEADIRSTSLPASMTNPPYDDMEPLHDWSAPYGE